MKDLVTRGTGNSRYLKSSIPAGTTWEEALALFRAGTFPIDLKGLNSAGVSTTGSAYNKANVLPDSLCSSLGITSSTAEPKDAWNAVLQKINTVNISLTNFINNDFPQPSKQGVSRPNILENWFFDGGGSQNGNGRFPINQKGATSQTAAGYFIDRWKHNANGSVSIANAGLTIVGTGSANCGLYQPIEYSAKLLGKQVTISFLNVAGSLASATFTLPSSMPSTDTSYGQTSTIGGVTCNLRGTSSYFYFQFFASATSTTAIKAAKMELGPNQTLARQVGSTYVLTEIPHFATELMKCQRHMIVFPRLSSGSGNSDVTDSIGIGTVDSNYHFYAILPLPIAMRTSPSLSGNLYVRYDTGTYDYYTITPSDATVRVKNNCLLVDSGYIYSLRSYVNQTLFLASGYSTAIFDANL